MDVLGRFFSGLFGKKDARLLIVGLDAAGKTTLLYQLKLGTTVQTVPTIGFNVETLKRGNVTFTAWDVGLRSKTRPLLKHYFANTKGIVFVFDTTDTERIDEAKEFLEEMLAADELKKCPILIYANKQDKKCMTAAEVGEIFNVKQILEDGRKCHVQGCSAISGDGLYEGLDWFSKALGYVPEDGDETRTWGEWFRSFFSSSRKEKPSTPTLVSTQKQEIKQDDETATDSKLHATSQDSEAVNV